jgi:stage II sporulation protein D
MKKFKPFIVLASILFAVTLIIPAILVLPFMDGKASGKLGENLQSQRQENGAAATANPDKAVTVAVYRTQQSQIEKVDLENYLVGVVAAEMPAKFEEEALKAQALTARTYIVKKMLAKDRMGVPTGADVSDDVLNQAYMNDAEQRKAWGAEYNQRHKKILAAVLSTSGQILTYKGDPISALFFSTSNGYTENSEEVWSGTLPYLRSVPSPWDKKSPKFTSQKVVSVNDFQAALGVKISNGKIGEITKYTAGKRVGEVNFNGKKLTGKEIREKLGLKSADFTWTRKGNIIVINTKGNGHGVGMSQYGANGMAAEGKTYKDIVKYYYKGVEISSAENMFSTITASK